MPELEKPAVYSEERLSRLFGTPEELDAETLETWQRRQTMNINNPDAPPTLRPSSYTLPSEIVDDWENDKVGYDTFPAS